MKISEIKPDDEMCIKGVDVPFGAPDENGKQAGVLLAFANNEFYRAKLAKLTRNAAQQIPGRELPTETFQKLNRTAMIGTVLLGWHDFEDDDGTPINDKDANGVIHKENAEKLLAVPIFFDFVNGQSGRLELFQKGKDESAAADIKSRPALEPKVDA